MWIKAPCPHCDEPIEMEIDDPEITVSGVSFNADHVISVVIEKDGREIAISEPYNAPDPPRTIGFSHKVHE